MFRELFTSYNPLGCHITDHEVRLMQVVRGSSGQRQILAEWASLADGRSVVDVVKQLHRSTGFQGRQVVSLVAPEQVWCRKLRLAPMPDEEIPAAARWTAAREMKIGIESFTAETLKLATVRDGTSKIEVLTVGAENSVLEEHARMLVQCGLEPVAIDAPAWADARALTGGAAKGTVDPLLLLDIGPKSSDMIVASKGEVMFLHRMEGGVLRIAELLGHRLGMSLAEARAWIETPEGATPDTSAAGKSPAFNAQQLATATSEAARMFGRELAREVSLSLHHFQQVLNGVIPEAGVMLGSFQARDVILDSVGQMANVEFIEVQDLIAPHWLELIKGKPGRIEQWLGVMGLALYSAAAQAPAEAA